MFSLYYSLISFRTQNSCTLATEVREPALVSPVAMTSVGTALAAIVGSVAYSAKASVVAAGELFWTRWSGTSMTNL